MMIYPDASSLVSWRRWLAGLAVCLTVIAFFYIEENWRGKRAWENCKRALEAQGVKMDWAAYVPAPVPAEENVFGVPEMQQWFVARTMEGIVRSWQTALSGKLSYPGYGSNRTARLVLAELTIGLPVATAPSASGAAVLHWGDPRAQAEAGRLIRDALGPVVMDPVGFNFMLRSPSEIRPAQILLQCQTAPSAQELLQFLPRPLADRTTQDNQKIQVEPVGAGSYKVTMLAPDTVAEFLKWSERLEPEFTLIRQALQRPYTRMDGDYSEQLGRPIPNFVCIRDVAQRLAAIAQCHLVEGKPDEALRDLTLMHDLCRIMEGSRPMTLMSATFNVAVRRLYVGAIAEGLLWHAWREPQLAALEEQLQKINLLTPCKQAVETERVSMCHFLETMPPTKFFSAEAPYYPSANVWTNLKAFILRGGIIPRRWVAPILGRVIPRGWVYQNMVTSLKLGANFAAPLDADNEIIFSDKVEDFNKKAQVFSPGSPYAFLIALATPNFTKAVQTTARNQTELHQALIACALERYHLAHGGYPETLGALAPQFIAAIPHDVIGGRPPHYRRADGGTFILYSIGWDGRDHGGARGQTTTDGDWVWADFSW